MRYRPGEVAHRLGMSVLVSIAEDDHETPEETTRQIAERAPCGELRRYLGTHFGIYRDPMRRQVLADQADFLRTPGGRRECEAMKVPLAARPGGPGRATGARLRRGAHEVMGEPDPAHPANMRPKYTAGKEASMEENGGGATLMHPDRTRRTFVEEGADERSEYLLVRSVVPQGGALPGPHRHLVVG
jgi:hypothetical protein